MSKSKPKMPAGHAWNVRTDKSEKLKVNDVVKYEGSRGTRYMLKGVGAVTGQELQVLQRKQKQRPLTMAKRSELWNQNRKRL